MIVVDTPATPTPEARLVRDGALHAPHLLDIAFLHALRRLVIGGQLAEDRADEIRSDFDDVAVARYPHQPLLEGVWSFRHRVSACDGIFLALAEAPGVPLVPCDGRLARGGAGVVSIELDP
ncbi:MAG TPA: type II toxin-antitoxin system VapC family toxin [Candidatus Micrarchaeia archaeon]|nr:type II toxin-antitoxin system VapC family toxin [Candidatus Micrarchaeia archaeon]